MQNLKTLLLLSAALAALTGEARAQTCLNNLVTNGSFTDGWVSGSMPSPGAVTGWSMQSNSPQVIGQGCADLTGIAMWGNQVVGESIKQALPGVGIEAGQQYSVKVCYRWYGDPGSQHDYVRFRLTASAAAPVGYPPMSSNQVIGITPNSATHSWSTYTFPDWTATSNAAWITINPENDSTVNDGALVSWGYIDDICITKVVPVATENRSWGQIKGTYR